MIAKKIEEALNLQIMEEEHASRIYLAMASWCDANAYPGAAAFLYRHTNEEREHAEKILKYVNYRDMPNWLPFPKCQINLKV